MAEGYTPFNAMFDPEKQGTLTGFLGGLMGSPTRSQAEGGAVGVALEQIGQLRAQGKTPQEAALAFFQTPQGQDFFANAGPTGMDQLIKGLAATQAPAPTLTQVAQGGQLYSTNQQGKTSLVGSNPQSFAPTVMKPGEIAVERTGKKIAQNDQPLPDTDEVRTFKAMTAISRLPDAEIRKLAIQKLDPTKRSVESDAIDEMVSKYGLDPQVGEKLKAGVYKIVEGKNEFGASNGEVSLLDMSNPNNPIIQRLKPGPGVYSSSPSAQPLPGTQPDNGAATGRLPAAPPAAPLANPSKASDNKKFFGSKADMFLGSGIVPNAMSVMSNVSEQLNPGAVIPEGARSNDRQNLINIARNSIAAMGQMGEGLNVNKATLESYMKLLPTGGTGETPHEAVQKGIRLHENVTQEIEAAEANARDTSLPTDTRKNAVKIAEGWKKVLRTLPSYDEMTKMEEAIREGTAGAPTLVEGAKSVIDAGKKMFQEGKKQAKDAGVDVEPEPKQDFGKMDAEQLLAIDPRTLNKQDKILHRRALDRLEKTLGKRSDVVEFPSERVTPYPHSVGANNRIGIRRGGGGSNVIPIKRG